MNIPYLTIYAIAIIITFIIATVGHKLMRTVNLYIGVTVMSIAILMIPLTICLPELTPSGKYAHELKTEYKDLKNSMCITQDYHNNISEHLYTKLKTHNDKINNMEQTFWTKAMKFEPEDYIFDLETYTIVSDDGEILQTPKSTETTESSTASDMEHVVEIDGEYYKLIPIR